MLYLDPSDLPAIVDVISRYYVRQEEVPDYMNEPMGIEQLFGVFQRVHSDYYQTLIDKVVYLFIQINKGHFFSNGNKRLALVVALGFLFFNDKRLTPLTKEEFRLLLSSVFLGCDKYLEDDPTFTADDFALYNLSIIVADSHKYVDPVDGFEDLKERVQMFFVKTVV
jgi:prophage maintenance system killer protein